MIKFKFKFKIQVHLKAEPFWVRLRHVAGCSNMWRNLQPLTVTLTLIGRLLEVDESPSEEADEEVVTITP